MDLGKKLRALRKKAGMTQDEVAEIVGTTKQNIYKYEKGVITNIPRKRVEELAELFDVDPSYLLGWVESGEDDLIIEGAPSSCNLDSQRKAFPSKSIKIPLFGTVAAGYPSYAYEDIEEYEEIPQAMAGSGDYFALRIKGNSMNPRILDGDVIIVRRQDDVDSGQIAVVLVGDDEATCKKVIKKGNDIILMPINPEFDPMVFSPYRMQTEPVRIIGRVVQLRAQFR